MPNYLVDKKKVRGRRVTRHNRPYVRGDRSVMVRVTPAQHVALKAVAASRLVSIGFVVRAVITNYLRAMVEEGKKR